MTTNTERDELARVISQAVGGWNAETRAITNVADAILASDVWCNRQAEAPSEDVIEAATWALIDYDTDAADRGVSDEHYQERRADVERVAPILAARPVMDEATAKDIVARMRGHQQVMEDPDGWLWTCTCGKWHGGDFDVHCLMAALTPDGQEKNR